MHVVHPLLAVLAASAAAVEVEPAKLATADAMPIAQGTWELALSAAWVTAERALDAQGSAIDRGGRRVTSGLGIGLTYGVAEGVDAGIGIGYGAVRDEAADPDHGAGVTDLGLGAKWRCWSGHAADAAVAVALLPGLTVPMGQQEDTDRRIPIASRYATTGLTLAVSGNLGRVALGADAGYIQAWGSEGDRAGYVGTGSVHAALGFQATAWLQPEVEGAWSRDRVDAGNTPWSLTATAGAQIGLPWGRLGIGVQRVVAGAWVDQNTSLIAMTTLAF